MHFGRGSWRSPGGINTPPSSDFISRAQAGVYDREEADFGYGHMGW